MRTTRPIPTPASRRAFGRLVLLTLAGVGLGAGRTARAQGSASGPAELATLTPAQLLDRFRGGVAVMPTPGKIRGTPLIRPGTALAPQLSAAGRGVWQGKVFRDDATVVNRFFGVRSVKARVLTGPSWIDGAPTLILDYQDTSRIYSQYRDEIRQVAPGLLLGVMFDRCAPGHPIERFFVLETGCP